MWKWANDKKTMQFFFVNGEGVSNYLALSFLAVNLALSHALPVESALFRARRSFAKIAVFLLPCPHVIAVEYIAGASTR